MWVIQFPRDTVYDRFNEIKKKKKEEEEERKFDPPFETRRKWIKRHWSARTWLKLARSPLSPEKIGRRVCEKKKKEKYICHLACETPLIAKDTSRADGSFQKGLRAVERVAGEETVGQSERQEGGTLEIRDKTPFVVETESFHVTLYLRTQPSERLRRKAVRTRDTLLRFVPFSHFETRERYVTLRPENQEANRSCEPPVLLSALNQPFKGLVKYSHDIGRRGSGFNVPPQRDFNYYRLIRSFLFLERSWYPANAVSRVDFVPGCEWLTLRRNGGRGAWCIFGELGPILNADTCNVQFSILVMFEYNGNLFFCVRYDVDSFFCSKCDIN